MRLVSFFQRLDEGRSDRYLEMFNIFKQTNYDDFYRKGETITKWAIESLKREDRIIWYLRYIRLGYLHAILDDKAGNPDDDPTHQILLKLYNRELSRMKIANGNGNENQIINDAINIQSINQVATRLKHFIDLDLPKINSIVFSFQMLNPLLRELEDIEREWKENIGAGVLELDGDETVIIQFPDNSAWFNLNRSGCSKEGEAMGHCGNGYGNRGETVLSYRSRVDDTETGKTFWKPHLTFILDITNGKLGEMKGRGNQKPNEKYHPVIIALLKNPLIKGIRGGGYLPENNFSLDDLEPDVVDTLIKEKPSLATMRWRVKNDLNDTVIADIINETELLAYDNNKQSFIADYYSEFNEIAKTAKIDERFFDGEMFQDMGWDSIDTDGMDDILTEILKRQPEWLKPLVLYVADQYPETFSEYLEIDMHEYETEQELNKAFLDEIRTNRMITHDIIRTLEDESDDLAYYFRSAAAHGLQYGAEKEFHNSFIKWLSDPTTSDSANVYFAELDNPVVRKAWGNFYDENTQKVVHDKRDVTFYYALFCPLMTAAELYDGVLETYSGDYAETLDEAIEYSTIDEPHYGWSGYDEEGAIDSFFEMDGRPLMQDIAKKYTTEEVTKDEVK